MRSLVTRQVQSPAPSRPPVACILLSSFLFLLVCFKPTPIAAQCAGIVSTPGAAADCAAHAIPVDTVAKLYPVYPYTLADLIDIAEHNNPLTRIVWDRAQRKADALGV